MLFLFTIPVAADTDRAITVSKKTSKYRTALVVGNSSYKTAPLKNPVNDARDMAQVLRESGFEVILKTNANQREMEKAVRNFGKRLRRGGAGLFYYAGHGIQVKGRNYLVPIGATIETEADVKYEAVDAGLILGKMEDAANDLNIVILDACRNNPFARSFRSAEQGLARMDAPKGTLVAYATAPGSVAADGESGNGIYTKNLIDKIKTPGLTVEQALKQVRVAVLSETENKQIPWESSSLTGNFYFFTSGGSVRIENSTASISKIDPEEEMWLLVKDAKRVEDVNLYLQEYPNGRFRAHAKLLISKLSYREQKPPSPTERYKIIFEERFTNNAKKWPTQSDQNTELRVTNGKYLFAHKRDTKAWEVRYGVSLNSSDDFTIEYSSKKVDGADNSQYGLIWGWKDAKNMYYFQILGDGRYLYGKQVNGKYNNILAWKHSKFINRGNALNHIKLKKIGDRIKFYINGKYVDETGFEPFFGKQIGFRIDERKRVEFDDLIVKRIF